MKTQKRMSKFSLNVAKTRVLVSTNNMPSQNLNIIKNDKKRRL